MEHANPANPRNLDGMIEVVSSLFSELNLGLLIYHLEVPDDPKRLKLVYANQAASEYTGTDLGDLVGQYILEAFPALADTDLPAHYAEVVNTKKSRNIGAFEYGDNRVKRGYFAVKAFPMPSQCAGVIFENITTRKHLEELVKKLTGKKHD